VEFLNFFRMGSRKSKFSVGGLENRIFPYGGVVEENVVIYGGVLAKKIVGGSRMSCRGGGVSGVKNVVKRGTDVFTF